MPSTRDQRPYNVNYYRGHRREEIERVTRRQQATLAFLRDLRRVPCMDCCERFEPHQMDFDHRDPSVKSYNLTSAGAMLKRRDLLMGEVAKCDIVCANCHAARSYRLQGERWMDRRKNATLISTPRAISRRRRSLTKRELLLVLRTSPCHDCGRRLPAYLMQFDHRVPALKRFEVANSWCRSDQAIVTEALKCDIVCPNCHRDRTFRRRTKRVWGSGRP